MIRVDMAILFEEVCFLQSNKTGSTNIRISPYIQPSYTLLNVEVISARVRLSEV